MKIKLCLLLCICLLLGGCRAQRGMDAPPELYENRDSVAAKQRILDSLDGLAELRWDGERKIGGADCYVYSAYLPMTQDDGGEEHREMRLVGIYGIGKEDGRVYHSADGETWAMLV